MIRFFTKTASDGYCRRQVGGKVDLHAKLQNELMLFPITPARTNGTRTDDADW